MITDTRRGGIAPYAEILAKRVSRHMNVLHLQPKHAGIFGYIWYVIHVYYVVLKERLKDDDIHVNIQSMIWPATLLLMLLLKLICIDFSFDMHDDPLNLRQKYRPKFIRKITLNMADNIVCHSRYGVKLLRKAGIDTDDVVCVPLAPLLNFPKLRPRTPKRFTLTFFGLVKPYKGISVLIEAIGKVKNDIRGMNILIIGKWCYDKEPTLKRIRELGIERNTRIIDEYVSDEKIARAISKSDAVVLPYTEVTQTSLPFNAYSLKKPVIATAVGGIPEIVKDKKTGLLIRPDDADSLARAMKFAYKNRGKMKGWGKEGYRMISGDWDTITKGYENMIKGD